jgi:sugar/nucleoside kinase (ribokinase family)
MKRMYENHGEELIKIFERAKASGATTSLDMSLPDPSSDAGWADWISILTSVLPFVDIFMPSIEELLFMLQRSVYEHMRLVSEDGSILEQITPKLLSGLGRDLTGLGVKILMIKLGDRGIYLRTAEPEALKKMGRAQPTNVEAWADQELWAPCFNVDVVGTTGAGDATIAGFLSALLRDMSPAEAATAAVAVGACNVEAADALSGLRTWDDTWQRIQSGWARHTLDLDAPGWRFDEAHQLLISINPAITAALRDRKESPS